MRFPVIVTAAELVVIVPLLFTSPPIARVFVPVVPMVRDAVEAIVIFLHTAASVLLITG